MPAACSVAADEGVATRSKVKERKRGENPNRVEGREVGKKTLALRSLLSAVAEREYVSMRGSFPIIKREA
mgnify:CR=1 FL=1